MKRIEFFFGLSLLFAGFGLTGSTAANAQTRQEHIHNRAHMVMPFDVSKTVHIFKMTEFGGIQKVLAKDPNDS